VADIFREHSALSSFENGGRAISTSAIHRGDRRRSLSHARAVRMGGGRFLRDGGFFHADPRARFIATIPRDPFMRPNRERPCGSTPAGCVTSGTP
jgi:assimilatory nitrate reductase catalytic subunit